MTTFLKINSIFSNFQLETYWSIGNLKVLPYDSCLIYSQTFALQNQIYCITTTWHFFSFWKRVTFLLSKLCAIWAARCHANNTDNTATVPGFCPSQGRENSAGSSPVSHYCSEQLHADMCHPPGTKTTQTEFLGQCFTKEFHGQLTYEVHLVHLMHTLA